MASDITSAPDNSSFELRILAVPPTAADGKAMGRLLRANGVDFQICGSIADLCVQESQGAGLLLISEEAVLQDVGELATCLSGQPVWSDIPVMVLSRGGREPTSLMESVIRLGNVTVIERPVRTSTLMSLVRSGLRARERQYQVREHIAEQQHAQQIIREGDQRRQELLESERAARAEAERANRIKEEFLATLSHELRTPLNAVMGWAKLLRKSADLSADMTNGLTVIERNARSQAQIIDDLLDMSSIISGKVRLEVQPLQLIDVIDATVETIRPAAQTKGIQLRLDVDPAAGMVRGDPNRLQQVLWNLLTNALKFSPRDSEITIALSRTRSLVVLEVSDKGEGIDPVFLPHVFDRFRQADASSTRRHGGLGLGLSIVKQLVELHGGSISARSPGAGKGASFRIVLPMVTEDRNVQPNGSMPVNLASPAELGASGPGTTADLGGLKILVVDDEPDARLLVQRFLEDYHANVSIASSAEEAMQMLQRDRPDMLISDIGMPGEDGYGFIRRVRALAGDESTVPAIALTAYVRKEDRAKAIAAGFQAHLAKPIDPNVLVAMVESLAARASVAT